MRILSNNECEMICGGVNDKGPQDKQTDRHEELSEEKTGVPHDCSWGEDHNGNPMIICTPRRPSPHRFLG